MSQFVAAPVAPLAVDSTDAHLLLYAATSTTSVHFEGCSRWPCARLLPPAVEQPSAVEPPPAPLAAAAVSVSVPLEQPPALFALEPPPAPLAAAPVFVSVPLAAVPSRSSLLTEVIEKLRALEEEKIAEDENVALLQENVAFHRAEAGALQEQLTYLKEKNAADAVTADLRHRAEMDNVGHQLRDAEHTLSAQGLLLTRVRARASKLALELKSTKEWAGRLVREFEHRISDLEGPLQDRIKEQSELVGVLIAENVEAKDSLKRTREERDAAVGQNADFESSLKKVRKERDDALELVRAIRLRERTSLEAGMKAIMAESLVLKGLEDAARTCYCFLARAFSARKLPLFCAVASWRARFQRTCVTQE